MTKAISAAPAFPKAQPQAGMHAVQFEVLVETEGEGPITIPVMAHDQQHALDQINGMPEPMLREKIGLERMIAAAKARMMRKD